MGEAVLRPAALGKTVLLLVVVGALVSQDSFSRFASDTARASPGRTRSVGPESVVLQVRALTVVPPMTTGDGLAVSVRSSAPLALRIILGWVSSLVPGEGVLDPGLPDRVRVARKHESGTHTAQREHGASAHPLHHESSPSAESRSRYSSVVSSPFA